MIFPNEVWLEIADILEHNDDKKTLATLARCNKNLLRVITKPLYRRFIVKATEKEEEKKAGSQSVALFHSAILKNPRLRREVQEISIGHFTDIVRGQHVWITMVVKDLIIRLSNV